MRVQGEHRYQAPPELVWQLFTDPEALRKATPGCESLEPKGEGVYAATMTVGVAAVRGTFHGTIQLSEMDPPRRYRLRIKGEGAAGFVEADGAIEFHADGESTSVKYDFQVQVGGPIAGVGQRVLGGVAKYLLGLFFKNMEEQLAAARSR